MLGQFEFVFYVSARDTEALSGKSAIDVLRLDEFDLTVRQQEEVVDYLSQNSEKVLILLDGADESGELWFRCKGLQKILQRKGGLHRCSFVISSRPCEVAYRLVPMCDQHFYFAGLSERHLEELLYRRLGEEEACRLSDELKQVQWSQLRTMMLESPLVANMVTALAGSSAALPRSLTELYTVMVVNMVRRSAAKAERCIVQGALENIPAGAKASLLSIGKLALNGLKGGRHVFHLEKDVRSTCGELTQLFGLLEEFRTVSLRGECHEAQFLHLTFQEFLAAYHVSQSSEVELEGHCREIGFGEHMWPFWRFVGGLLGLKNVTALVSFLNKSGSEEKVLSVKRLVVLKMICFAEAVTQPCPDDEDAEELSRNARESAGVFLPHTLDLFSGTLSVSDMHAVSVSLAHAKHVHTVCLTYCDLDCGHARALSVNGGLRYVRCLDLTGNPKLRGHGLAAFASAFGQDGPLLTISMSHCRLDSDDCATLCDVLKANPSLRDLYLSWNAFSAAALERLHATLACSVLEHLDLKKTQLNAECGRVIGDIIAHSDHLRHVDLSGNNLGNGGVEAVVRGAVMSRPGPQPLGRELLFADNALDDGVLTALLILLCLQSGQPLQSSTCNAVSPTSVHLAISLGGNDISLAALRQFAKQLPPNHEVQCGMFTLRGGELHRISLSAYLPENKAVHNVLLWGMQIDCEGAAEIATRLAGNRCSVQDLNLMSNSIGNVGAGVLSLALASNSSLRCLQLGYNRISRPCDIFSVFTESNSTLTWLELCGNSIFDEQKSGFVAESCEALFRLLTDSRGLKYIGLGLTGLGDKECHVLQKALSANSSGITFLSLGRNRITCRGAVALARGLEQNATLRYVNLSLNCIGDGGATAVAQCVQARKGTSAPLQRVYMGGNRCDASSFVAPMVDAAFFYTNFMHSM